VNAALDSHTLSAEFRAFDLPAGRIDKLYLHWSAGTYDAPSSAYHFVVGYRDARLFAQQTHDVRENMRVVSAEAPYAAHTRRRNSYAIGVSALSMLQATPHDFGPYPLTPQLVDALCALSAYIARRYAIAVDGEHVMTHAEAALSDGYFGLAPDERWDLARLQPAPDIVTPAEARASGEYLRRLIRQYLGCGR
jgi:hypothetical protein